MLSDLRELPDGVPAPVANACIRHGARAFVDHLPVVLFAGLGVWALGAAGEGLLGGPGVCIAIGLLGLVFFVRPLEWGFSFLCLRGVREEDPRPGDVLRAFRRYGDVVLGHLTLVVMVVVGLCLLIVPGVIFYLRTRFVRYLVVEDGLDFLSAIRESFALTAGRTRTLLAITAAGWLAVAMGTLPLGLGIAPALIWWDLSLASLYYAATESEELWESEAPLADPSTA